MRKFQWIGYDTASFNSPWECRIGLTQAFTTGESWENVVFQFPVGMSNKSYWKYGRDARIKIHYFQFPVGMSNKSYCPEDVNYFCLNFKLSIPRGNVEQVLLYLKVDNWAFMLSFNSPWECRISLTSREPVRAFALNGTFQFPVGMSNRSYFITYLSASLVCEYLLSIPRGNVEQVLLAKDLPLRAPPIFLSIPRGNVEQVLLSPPTMGF